MNKIVFVGGGTLGHISPLLPVAKSIYHNYDLYFIGTKTGLEKDLIDRKEYFHKKFYLDMQGFRRSISLYNLLTIRKYFRCSHEAKKILKSLKPDLVIGFGGYISGVVIRAAIKLKIKTIIHEQNSVLGLANKVVEKKVDRVFLSFPVEDKLKNKNVLVIGNPRLSEIYYQNRIKREEKRMIVVVGGSRGSEAINNCVLQCLPNLIKQNYHIVLITGNKYYQKNKAKILKYNSENIEIIAFTTELIQYLKKASVVVSRSGATTLVELLALRKVCILIPSPNVTNNHQYKNADIFVRNKSAVMLLEKDLTPEVLIEYINKLETDYELRINLITNMLKMVNFKANETFIKEMEKIL